MSTQQQFTVAEIQQQNKVFQQAYQQGKITSAQYAQAMRVQNAALTAAQAREAAQQPKTTPNNNMWTNPTSSSFGPNSNVEINPPSGYAATNVHPETVELPGPIAPGQTSPLTENVIAYDLVPKQEPPKFVEPTLENINSNPIGVLGTIVNVASIGAAGVENDNVGKALSGAIGYVGEGVNQATQAKNVVNAVTGQPKETLPFTPKSETQNTGQTAFRVGQAVGAAVAAPIIGPAIGVSAPAIIAGEGISVGINQAIKVAQGNGKPPSELLLTPEEAIIGAAEGGAFALVGGGVLKGVGAIGKAAGLALPETVAGKALAAGGRVGMNTVLGAGGGYVISGGDIKAAQQGAMYGAAFGVAGEIIGAVAPKVAGIKATEIKGAKEYYTETTVGPKTETVRVTEFDVGTTRLRGADIEKYSQYNIETLRNPKLDMAGKQTLKTITKDITGVSEEVTRFDLPVESTRSAEPAINAISGKEFQMGRVAQGTRGIEKVTIRSGEGQVSTGGLGSDKPATFLEKTTVMDKGFIVDKPDVLFSGREYTGIKVRGILDESQAADAIKALPRDTADAMYKKLGGGYKQMVDFGTQSKDLSGAMKKGSNEFFQEKEVPTSKGNSLVEIEKVVTEKPISVTGQKEVTLDRAIVNVEPQATNPVTVFAGRSYYPQKTREVVEDQYLTMPGEVQRLDVTSTASPDNDTPKPIQQVNPLVTGNSRADVLPTIVPDITHNIITPDVIPDLVPNITPDVVPDITHLVDIVDKTTGTGGTPAEVPKETLRTPPGGSNVTGLGFPLLPSGFKFEGAGGGLGFNLKSVGLFSRKRVYPIASGADILNLDLNKRRSRKRAKKGKAKTRKHRKR